MAESKINISSNDVSSNNVSSNVIMEESNIDVSKNIVIFIGKWNKILEIDIKNINTQIQNNKKILILVVNDVPKNDENISIDSIVENLNKTFKNHIDLNNVTIQVIPKISEILYEKNYKISSNLMRDQIFYITKAFSWRAVGTLDTIFLAWLITKDPLTGLTIGAAEFITKTVLYYFHDLLWDKCIRHLKCCKR
uniref:DUF2061 domain-containing protein n=1 Tax=viral metagenome TaxID=1070528 RepID=A0A6C0H0J5_9ZZZZ